MYPRLSSAAQSLPQDEVDVYVFCAPRGWRRNVRTLFYALERGRSYAEDGNVRDAQRVGREIASTLMICDTQSLISEIRKVKDAIEALHSIPTELRNVRDAIGEVSQYLGTISRRNYCCKEVDTQPDLLPPGPNPLYPPDYSPPFYGGGQEPTPCQIGHAAVYRTKHILQRFIAILSAPEMDFTELRHALSEFGVPDNVNLIAAVSIYAYGLIVDALRAILPAYNLIPGGLRALQEDGFALVDAVEQRREELACTFANGHNAASIQESYNEILFSLTDNLLWRGVLWAAHYVDIFAQFLSARDPNSDIYGAFTNMPDTCNCLDSEYLLKDPTYLNVESASQCTYEVLPGSWYRVAANGPFPSFVLRRRYSEGGFVAQGLVITVRNNNCTQAREIREDLGPGVCHTFVGLFAGEERKTLVTTPPNPPAALVDYINAIFPGAVLMTPPVCDVGQVRDILSQVRYGPGSWEMKVLYIVRRT